MIIVHPTLCNYYTLTNTCVHDSCPSHHGHKEELTDDTKDRSHGSLDDVLGHSQVHGGAHTDVDQGGADDHQNKEEIGQALVGQ